jgi:hypothetical protein
MMRSHPVDVEKRSRIRIACAIAAAIALCPRVSWAEEAAGAVSLFPILLHVEENPDKGVNPTEVAAFSDALRSGLERNLEAAGYSIAAEEEPLAGELPESREAQARARKALSSWAAVCELSLASGRIDYRIAIYDVEDGSLGAGDGFSAFAGLAALTLLEHATARTVEKLAAYESERRGSPRRLVGYRLVVACPFDGAEVSLDIPGASAPAHA